MSEVRSHSRLTGPPNPPYPGRSSHRGDSLRLIAPFLAASVALGACGRSDSPRPGSTPGPRDGDRDGGGTAPRDGRLPSAATGAPTLAEVAAVATVPATLAADPSPDAAWLVFLYLNWPATAGRRGVPDPSRPLGATPTVWQTWKEVHETYLAGGVAPGPWDDGGPPGPPLLSLGEIDGRTLADRQGAPITYTVALNQATFGYVVDRGLYGWAGQAALRSPGAAPVTFPPEAMEIKASWRLATPADDVTRYLVAQARMPSDGGGAPLPVTVLLTGLHVTSKARPDWIWMTFEQVDNPTTTGVTPRLPIAPAVAAANARFQARLAGTPWASYQLMGIQTTFTTDDGQPTLLANTQIETYFQATSSCISCHALASVSTGAKPRLDFFTLSGGNLVGPTGAPPTAPFGPGPDQFTALDFVWSLREAKR